MTKAPKLPSWDLSDLFKSPTDPKIDASLATALKHARAFEKKWKGNRFIIESLKGYKDDICDAVAAVAFEAYFSKIVDVLPRSRLINTGTRIR